MSVSVVIAWLVVLKDICEGHGGDSADVKKLKVAYSL
jgi:hypothetical protein